LFFHPDGANRHPVQTKSDELIDEACCLSAGVGRRDAAVKLHGCIHGAPLRNSRLRLRRYAGMEWDAGLRRLNDNLITLCTSVAGCR
jgi:hypothetical protein